MYIILESESNGCISFECENSYAIGMLSQELVLLISVATQDTLHKPNRASFLMDIIIDLVKIFLDYLNKISTFLAKDYEPEDQGLT